MLLKIVLAMFNSMLVLIWSATICNGLKQPLPCPKDCSCSALLLSISCRGDNTTFVNAIKTLPADIDSFTFTMFTPQLSRRMNLDLNGVDHLGKFFNLRNFTLQHESESKSFMYHMAPLQNDLLCNWTHLEMIRLNAQMLVNPNAFNCLKNLNVLDLSYTKGLQDHSLRTLLSVRLSRHITALFLREIQTFNNYETSCLDFTELFSDLEWKTIEVIDLRSNAIRSVSPGLLLFKNLKRVELSGNFFFGSIHSKQQTIITGLEVLIHPTLQVANIADQGIFATKHIQLDGSKNQINVTVLTHQSFVIKPEKTLRTNRCSYVHSCSGSVATLV